VDHLAIDANLRRERESDLLTSHYGVFQFEDREKIMTEAFAREAKGEAWVSIVRDFHTSTPKYWGYKVVPTGDKSSKKPLTEEQIRRRDVWIFFWTALQSLVFIKGFIMYFGLNYSIASEETYGGQDTDFYGWGLAISLAVSASGLILFAIRKSRGREWT